MYYCILCLFVIQPVSVVFNYLKGLFAALSDQSASVV